jgi:hypothetical protein
VAAGSALLAWLGWAVLTSVVTSSSDPASGAPSSALAAPRTTDAAPPVTAAPGRADEGDLPPSGRDPFGDAAAVVPTGRATPDPTVMPGADGVAPSVARTTVTVTVAATYIGLYTWNGSRASFRVNARTYSVPVGTTFGPGLRFTAIVEGSPRCARVQHGEDTLTLCPGQVTALP